MRSLHALVCAVPLLLARCGRDSGSSGAPAATAAGPSASTQATAEAGRFTPSDGCPALRETAKTAWIRIAKRDQERGLQAVETARKYAGNGNDAEYAREIAKGTKCGEIATRAAKALASSAGKWASGLLNAQAEYERECEHCATSKDDVVGSRDRAKDHPDCVPPKCVSVTICDTTDATNLFDRACIDHAKVHFEGYRYTED